jgi:hypothetical protein
LKWRHYAALRWRHIADPDSGHAMALKHVFHQHEQAEHLGDNPDADNK